MDGPPPPPPPPPPPAPKVSGGGGGLLGELNKTKLKKTEPAIPREDSQGGGGGGGGGGGRPPPPGGMCLFPGGVVPTLPSKAKGMSPRNPSPTPVAAPNPVAALPKLRPVGQAYQGEAVSPRPAAAPSPSPVALKPVVKSPAPVHTPAPAHVPYPSSPRKEPQQPAASPRNFGAPQKSTGNQVPYPSGTPTVSTTEDFTCASCGNKITTTVIKALGKTWHQECFVCKICRKPFEGEFTRKGDDPYCFNCYNSFNPKPKNHTIPKGSENCGACSFPIEGQYVMIHEKKFHPECFTCDGCSKVLETTSKFYESPGVLTGVKGGKSPTGIVCVDCSESVCSKCGLVITTQDKFLTLKTGKIHSNCFGCSVCNAKLDIRGFHEKNGQPVCDAHRS